MRTKVIPIGNSKGVRIPKVLLAESGIADEVDITLGRDGLRITPIRRSVGGETAVLSEAVLRRDWDRPEEDMAWRDL